MDRARESSDELDELAHAGLVEVVTVDLSTVPGPAARVGAASGRGRIDILVNNVGAATSRPGGLLSVTDEQWSSSLAITLMAAVRATRSALPVPLDAGHGAIVTTCSESRDSEEVARRTEALARGRPRGRGAPAREGTSDRRHRSKARLGS